MGIYQGGRQTLTMGGATDPQQVSICRSAQLAEARNSPARDGLVRSCNALRAGNVARGRLVTDEYAIDGSLRSALDAAGSRLVLASPVLSAAHARLPGSQQRGFRIGTAVRLASRDATYAATLKAGLDSPTQQGFAIGYASPDTQNVNMTQPSSGISTPVLIGGGVAIAGLAALAYFLLR